ncbi:YfhO family protein [Niabella drilacis]|uniref:Membrane protein YfhO n=1 Tax=Niabella drilacis (strain DSM 25811 / CCM 8410 / CCUG 62505 / LMG 26954 / E90) TaxID=1285928 RepID=A0A1G6ZG24_NIADE|nr:YfhO family protein [Niabella drilacis]SDE01313.1 membrane protein YfhO [Niabella drilacis]
MKSNWVKKVVPHVIAVGIFVVVSLVFCKPVLEGNVLSQHDIIGWKGAAQNALDVKAKTGTLPLWNTNLFSGMPNYQIYLVGKSVLPDLTKVFGLGLPNPANFLFIACICFYILGLAMRLNPLTAVLGALAYGFATYNPVILQAGHETKMYAIGFMPLLLGGLLLIYNKRYWIGLAVATLGAYQELMSNHPQINYYFFIIAVFVTVFYVARWIREKDFKQIGVAIVLSGVAALVGLGAYYLSYAATKEYNDFTIRGGKTVEIKGDQVTNNKTSGLDEDYAFAYSMRMQEPLVLLMPKAVGGASIGDGTEVIGENSKVIEKLSEQGVPAQATAQLANLPIYWGGMINAKEVGTNGPPYVGALICLLALAGFVIVKGPLKWGLLSATALGIIMSWGSFFPGINLFLLHNLPLYNKFRAPSMALVIPQLALAVMAAVAVQKLFFSADGKDILKQHFKQILYVFGGLMGVIVLVYLGQSYTPGLAETILTGSGFDKSNPSLYPAVVAGLKADRQALFGGQLLRTLAFMALLLGVLYFYLKNALKPAIAAVILGLVLFVDLWSVDKKYLPDEVYVPRDSSDAMAFAKTPADEQILQDKDPHFRVLNFVEAMNGNHTAYYHRSVLGYHAAKLRIYQDIIDRYFSTGQPPQELLNALDTRYIVTQNQQGQLVTIPNPGAYGAAWFVKGLKPEADAASELQAIGSTQLRDTAVVPQAAVAAIGTLQADTTSRIQLTKYTNDEAEYTTTSNTPQFAVFSEVYYPAGWKATIDGKDAPIVKTNYFMRGVAVPAGKHTVKLVFAPETVQKGLTISYISSILVMILVLGGFALQWWSDRRKSNKAVV